jgi:hypothetical protein
MTEMENPFIPELATGLGAIPKFMGLFRIPYTNVRQGHFSVFQRAESLAKP